MASYIRCNSLVQKTSAQLYKDRDETGDIKFKIDDEEISAHKCVLAAISPKYKRQFYGDFDDKDKKVIEVKEQCVSADAFKEFLQFFYLDKLNLSSEHIGGVIFLAKECLVNQIYNECIKLLNETLSVENVCSRYHLAILHECEDLLNNCTSMIKENPDKVFATEEFINCDSSVLPRIVELAPVKCKATTIFEACIAWAKRFCAENNKDAEKNEHLREALGENLYQIRFGTMKFEEFIKYYGSYKTLFSDEERDEILYMISKKDDFKPKFFVENPSNEECASYDVSFNLVDFSVPVTYNVRVNFGTPIQCTRRYILNAVYVGPFSNQQYDDFINIKIVENFDKITLFDETRQIKRRSNEPFCFKLEKSIVFDAFEIYEILIQFPNNQRSKGLIPCYEFTNRNMNLPNGGFIKTSTDYGPITRLDVTILDNKK